MDCVVKGVKRLDFKTQDGELHGVRIHFETDDSDDIDFGCLCGSVWVDQSRLDKYKWAPQVDDLFICEQKGKNRYGNVKPMK